MPLDTVHFGILSFGTAAWEADVVRRHQLDREHGFRMEIVPFAGGEAGKVAIQANGADIIVSDLIWVARQRAEGNALAMTPYSRALGTLALPAESGIRSLSGLIGKRLGIAGGPLDKSWLLLRALTMRKIGKDIASLVEPVFGAPPLISNELETGRLDAVLTFWNFAARLEAKGARPLLTVSDMLGQLGISAEVPLLGYAFKESWAQRDLGLVDRFMACSRAAKAILARSDDEWRLLAPRLGTDDPAVHARLRQAYRDGIPGAWTPQAQSEAEKLFSILAELGGEQLVGSARSLDPATLWPVSAL
jgi:NitT/TauT family transport system substrate-binding protein